MKQAPLPQANFWSGKRVLLTGHTGFKGSWATIWLNALGAHTVGLSLAPETEPSLFDLAACDTLCDSLICDLRDISAVDAAIRHAKPDIVLHMAAQPIVGRSVRDPLETLSTNVMGTANLLERLVALAAPEAILVVTSDKVYANLEQDVAFSENDALGGKDPYSASKAATELVTRSFNATYFAKSGVPVATARCGNIIGGGDYSEGRIIPDIIRAWESGSELVLRHPEATRPWLHVLDGLAGYLSYVEALVAGADVPSALNFGPFEDRGVTVGEIADTMQAAMGGKPGWRHDPPPQSVEMRSLAVDSTLARNTLGWRDRIQGLDRLHLTASWHSAVNGGDNPLQICQNQISDLN